MIIITGGGSGIGRALAQALAQRGESVLICGRRERALMETAEGYASINGLVCDLATEQGRLILTQKAKTYTVIKAIVHNAGTIEPMRTLDRVSLQDWRSAMALNVETPLFMIQALFAQLQHARILNISSGAAHFPVKSWGTYCCSKAALSMMTRIWQEEYKELAIASVLPGIIDTDMQALIRNADEMDDAKLNFFHSLKAHNRLIDSSTVAAFLSWLLLDITSLAFRSQEWDIYNSEHHANWMKDGHRVPSLEQE